MKKYQKILNISGAIIGFIILVYVLWSNWYYSFSLDRRYPNLDKTCELDSDCEIGSADFCGYYCSPNEEDVYNKETVAKIRTWRGNPYINGPCPVVECVYSPLNYIPKCFNKQCIIEKSINCNSKIKICNIHNTITIKFIEKELQISIDNAKRACNCP